MNKLRSGLGRLFGSTTTRLSVTYLAIIMVMSIGFSAIFYNTSSRELGRQIPPPNRSFTNDFRPNDDNDPTTRRPSLNSFLRQRVEEGRHNLLLELIALNAGALVVGSIISYQLARRTLEPIEAAMEAQAQFVSDASHELRTPLTAIQASNEVALRKPGLTIAQAKEVIKSNSQDAERLQGLSEGLLRLARQENQPVELSPTSLQTVASDAMNRIIPVASLKGISVEDSVPKLKVLADAAGLTQAVTILLDNASKYSPPKSTLYLEGKQQGKYGFITVRDEGIGIAADELPHIFKRFYRVDSARTTGEQAGYGLGLSIAHKLIQQQHGELTVTSEVGKGSSFSIRLPLG